MKNAHDVKQGDALTNIVTNEVYEVLERLQYINPLYYPPVYAYKVRNTVTNDIKTVMVEDYEKYGIENWNMYKTIDGKPWIV